VCAHVNGCVLRMHVFMQDMCPGFCIHLPPGVFHLCLYMCILCACDQVRIYHNEKGMCPGNVRGPVCVFSSVSHACFCKLVPPLF
jgi:hypothetical protein